MVYYVGTDKIQVLSTEGKRETVAWGDDVGEYDDDDECECEDEDEDSDDEDEYTAGDGRRDLERCKKLSLKASLCVCV